ncbi:hypothetical protein AB0C95_12640 [Streptomyces caniferus]|uniref:hypothetical protein n=1 Tax=Streptomyces caniferus TaxID=285557 RepID=UPI00340B53F2
MSANPAVDVEVGVTPVRPASPLTGHIRSKPLPAERTMSDGHGEADERMTTERHDYEVYVQPCPA